MADNSEQRLHTLQEGSPWFWKIFGGAIMGLISILLLAHIQNINNLIDRSTIELRSDIKEARQELDKHKERLAVLEQGAYKDKLLALEKTVAVQQVSIDDLKQKLASQEASAVAVKDDLKTMREWNKDMTRQLQELREKMATFNAKKEPQP